PHPRLTVVNLTPPCPTIPSNVIVDTLRMYLYRFDFFIFSFYCSAHHRALHSFPTRRSSDLNSRSFACRASIRTPIAGSLGPIPLDRKSTRLNSSHVSISYAVFCLKKKSGPFAVVLFLSLFTTGCAAVSGTGASSLVFQSYDI